MYTLTIQYKAKEGDRVFIQNPHTPNIQEWGVVTRIEMGPIRREPGYYVHYNVMLDRKNPKGYYMHKHCSGDEILDVEPSK